MTQVTDTDIREIKSAIDANTKSIATLSERVESIIKITESNAKAITDLTLEMRLGFANVENKFTKLEGRIDTANARLTSLESNTKAIADLAEKVGELKNWKQIAIVIFTATVGGTIGWCIRGSKF